MRLRKGMIAYCIRSREYYSRTCNKGQKYLIVNRRGDSVAIRDMNGRRHGWFSEAYFIHEKQANFWSGGEKIRKEVTL
jgi:hypothetical protein